jgi:hypothetical protein
MGTTFTNDAPTPGAYVDQWWLNQQTNAQLRVIEAQQTVEKQALAFQKEKFNQVLSMYQGAFGNLNNNNSYSVPGEFNQNIDLFAPGGQYGVGAKAEIDRSANQALAAGQIGLASTGMSSGTNAAGLSARVANDAGIAKANIEDQRLAALSGALTAKGQAGLTAEQLRAQQNFAMLSSLSSLG